MPSIQDTARICLYFRKEPERDRWLPGDRHIRRPLHRLTRGKPRIGGVERVFINLCRGLDRLNVPYLVNLPFDQLLPEDRVGVLGLGRHALCGYRQRNPIVAGVALMTYPAEWPTLCEEYPVVRYLQHSEWANNVYKPYFGDRCGIWPVGIDTQEWTPVRKPAQFDFVLYDKVRWGHPQREVHLIAPMLEALQHRNLSFIQIRYGQYTPAQYKEVLACSKAMLFVCEHESQGLAYQEALASNVPVLAWDQGWLLDPERFRYGMDSISTSSVPYFDSRCGETFESVDQFESKLDLFLERLRRGELRPREYILENLTVEKCSNHFLKIVEDAYR